MTIRQTTANALRRPMLHATITALGIGAGLGFLQQHDLDSRKGDFIRDGYISLYAQSDEYTISEEVSAYFKDHPELKEAANAARSQYLADLKKRDPEGFALRERDARIRAYVNSPSEQNQRFLPDYARTQLEQTIAKHGAGGRNAYNATLEDIDFMTRIVATEVGENEPAGGIDGVINVVLNRYENTCFPNSIEGVLDATLSDGAKEFAAIHWSNIVFPQRGYDGKISAIQSLSAAGFSEEFIHAVQGRVIEHIYFPDNEERGTIDNAYGATFYANDSISDLEGMDTIGGPLEIVTRIGSHAFYGMPDKAACPTR